VRHGLFVVCAKNRQFVSAIFQRLAKSGDIAVTEYRKHTVNEAMLLAINVHELRAKVTH
jgi:hypothetical protein